jgi:stage III sporulation protein AD
MEIIKIVSFAMVCVVLILIVKNTRPEFAMMLEVLSGILIFVIILAKITGFVEVIQRLGAMVEFDKGYLGILLKIVGISYVAEFGIGFCKDSGQNAIASKLELSAKIFILIVSLPVIQGLFEVLTQILG